MDASDSNTTITTHHNVSQRGKAPAAPSTWVSMEDDERVDDVDGIPEPLKQMTLGGPIAGVSGSPPRQIRKVFSGIFGFARKFFIEVWKNRVLFTISWDVFFGIK